MFLVAGCAAVARRGRPVGSAKKVKLPNEPDVTFYRAPLQDSATQVFCPQEPNNLPKPPARANVFLRNEPVHRFYGSPRQRTPPDGPHTTFNSTRTRNCLTDCLSRRTAAGSAGTAPARPTVNGVLTICASMLGTLIYQHSYGGFGIRLAAQTAHTNEIDREMRHSRLSRVAQLRRMID